MRVQVRRYLREFVAIGALLLIAGFVGGTILENQRFAFPWERFYEVSGEFRTAQAVTPGQGQTVTVAGVKVGEIAGVRLDRGRALVRMRIERKYGPIYRDARMQLRPKTGLKDMQIQLEPGTPEAGAVPDGGTLPASNTKPDVNPDEVLAALDTDTRHYLKLTVAGLGEGLEGRGRTLRRIVEATQPTVEHNARVTRAIADRRHKLARLVHNVNLLATATGRRDRDIERAIDASAATFEAVASQDEALREALERLPGTLDRAHAALGGTRGVASELGPAARELRPTVAELPRAMRAARPLLRETTPVLARDVRPLTREAVPVVRDLGTTGGELRDQAPQAIQLAGRTARIVDQLVHNPDGPEEGYLFWMAWFVHNTASVLSVEDAHGAHWRGQAIFSCSTIQRLQHYAPDFAALFNLPSCPEVSGTEGGG